MMSTGTTGLRAAAAAVIAVAVLGACGNGDDAATDQQIATSTTVPATDTTDPGASASDGGANGMDGNAGMGAMGGADVTPADEVAGAEVVQDDFALLDSAPEGSTLSGTALLARTADSTIVTLRLQGLEPGRDYISHVHSGPCSESGGPHYKHDPNGGDTPPNEIHLAFTGPEDGTIEWSVTNPMRANDDAVSVVVHYNVENASKIACAQLS